MATNDEKIGVLSCTGEDCLGGTISRLATRKLMEKVRPGETVTLCLPLFLAGGEEERAFAKVYPTIALEGCDKCCAKKATEKYSAPVRDVLIVSDIIGKDAAESKALSTRYLTEEHKKMVDKVVGELVKRIDKVDAERKAQPSLESEAKGGCCCGGNCDC